MDIYNDRFPDALDLSVVSRRPTRLSAATVRAVRRRPVPRIEPPARSAANGASQDGLASIVVATFNNLVFTRMCLESVLMSTTDARYELIVVDNGSTDGSVEYLRTLRKLNPQVRVIFNQRNLGFARATNQGLKVARGDRLVLLNSDTIASGAWLTRLLEHLDDPEVGIVCPVTNRSGNEAEIETPYGTYGAYTRFAEARYHAFHGNTTDISSLVMFCAALRRDVWTEIGPLDERFESGMFEDDDYAMRLRAAGYRIVCAEDTSIHHFGQATIGNLAETGEFGRRFHANRERWEQKWERRWEPHRRRFDPAYARLVKRIRRAACNTIPLGASVAVVSNGDEDLVDLGSWRATHFPCDSEGTYAGYHPRDSDDAIAQLEYSRSRGVDYLLVPSTAYWWLDYYAAFRSHLERNHLRLAHDPETCSVYDLSSHDGMATLREERPIARTE